MSGLRRSVSGEHERVYVLAGDGLVPERMLVKARHPGPSARVLPPRVMGHPSGVETEPGLDTDEYVRLVGWPTRSAAGSA
jgi:hypothetical protein